MEIQLIFCFLIFKIVSLNLICNGDFQSCILNLTGFNVAFQRQYFGYFASNKSCWYTRYGTDYQVLKVDYGTIIQTKAADFISGTSYTLCQNITTNPMSIYRLNYTFIFMTNLTSGSISAFLDNIQICKVTYSSPTLVKNGTANFTATKNYHQICFQSTQTYGSNAYFASQQASPYLDNVHIQQIDIIPSSLPQQTNSTISNSNISNTLNNSYLTNESINQNSSNTNNQTSTPTPPSPNNQQYPSDTSNYIKTIYIHLRSSVDYLQNYFTLTSDLILKTYGLSPSIFDGTVITIKGQVQSKVQYYQNQIGYLVIKFYPQYIIDILNLKDMNIYYPPQLYQIQTYYKFQFIVDGKHVCYVSLSSTEYKQMEKLQKISTQMASKIYTTYIILNSLSCSYLIISLIGFWNVSLMYTFLMIENLPIFTRSFMTKIRDIFFLRGTVKLFINKIRNYNSNDDLIDFSSFQPTQKIQRYKQQYQWFNFVGMSSNSFSNNFDTFILMSLLILKFIFVKYLFEILSRFFEIKISITKTRFFYKFTEQLSCFCPFVIVSAFSTLINLSEQSAIPKINSILQLFLVFSLIFIPAVCFILKNSSIFQKTSRISLVRLQQHKQTSQYKSFQNIETLSWFILCVTLPLFITINNKILFMIISTCIIFFRFIYTIRNLQNLTWRQKIFKSISSFNWVIFQLTFLFYFTIDLLPQQDLIKMKDVIKYTGFIAIGCILFGAISDILYFGVRLIQFGRHLIKKLIKYIKNKIQEIRVKDISKSDLFNKNPTNKKQVKLDFSKNDKYVIKINQNNFINQKRKNYKKLSAIKSKGHQTQVKTQLNLKNQSKENKMSEINNELYFHKKMNSNKYNQTQQPLESCAEPNLHKFLIKRSKGNRNLNIVSFQQQHS